MAAGQVAQRYAKAWLSAAQDKKAVEAVSADCNALLSMIKSSTDFASFLASPLVKKTDQAKAIATISKQSKFHDVTASLLSVLAENRRLPALPEILQAAKAMIDAAAGTAQAQVTSATALDASKLADIRAQLKKKFGQDVAIETRVDPTIIGGLIVQVGSQMIDDSVKTKLDRMARRLTGQTAA
jgi:F-type H+-transporting ATPase subunit delta